MYSIGGVLWLKEKRENKVKTNIERRIESMGMQDFIFQVLVAEEEVPVLKEGIPTGKVKIKKYANTF